MKPIVRGPCVMNRNAVKVVNEKRKYYEEKKYDIYIYKVVSSL